jgi:hypothetical protein
MTMGRWGWAVLAIAVLGIVVAMATYQPYTERYTAPDRPAVHQADARQGPARRWRPFYQRHRDSVARVSDYSQRARTNRIIAVVCFLGFAFLTLPRNARDVRAFYNQLVATTPLPTEAGDDEENNRRARKVLFFYLLFLIYQVVQFPLTWGRDNAVQFYSDLGFQLLLLAGVLATFHSLKRGVAAHFEGDPEAHERMRGWMGVRLDGLTVRWRDLSRLALLMFVGAFAPPLLANLTNWLDVVASY